MFSIGMGGVLMPQRLSRVTARAEGVSLGMEGEELADFVTLLKGIDALEWRAALVRHGKRAAAEKKQNQPK